jgi:hypothetical protein
MTVEIRIAQNADAKEWDRIISESPQGTIFHYWDWLKITENHTRTKLYPLIGIKNGVPIGVYPLFFQRIGPIRMVFSPPPHAAIFYLGPVFAANTGLTQEKMETIYIGFHGSVENFIKHELSANYMSIALSPSLQDPRPFIWSGYSVGPSFDYVTDLRKGADYLLQSLDKKQRQDLNRAKKRGISVEPGGQKEIDLIQDIMTNRYEEQMKIVTVPPGYLSDIYDKFKDHIAVFVTRFEGEIVTGLINLRYRDTLYSWIGNPKPRMPISPSPNDLMAWEIIKYGCEKQLKFSVTMGAAGNERLHKYYVSKFNPELLVRYTAKKSSFVSGISEKGYINILKPLYAKMKPVYGVPEFLS